VARFAARREHAMKDLTVILEDAPGATLRSARPYSPSGR
jgi:hypothetical protein